MGCPVLHLWTGPVPSVSCIYDPDLLVKFSYSLHNLGITEHENSTCRFFQSTIVLVNLRVSLDYMRGRYQRDVVTKSMTRYEATGKIGLRVECVVCSLQWAHMPVHLYLDSMWIFH